MDESVDTTRLVTAALQARLGDALNTRGIVVVPSGGATGTGSVTFNLLDKRQADFGQHTWTYSLRPDGKVEFASELKQGEPRTIL